MMHIPQQQFQGYAEQYAASLARRARMYGAGKAANDTMPPPVPKVTPVQIHDGKTKTTGPLWKRSPIKFNDHEISYQMHLARQACSPAIGYLRKRCDEIGVDLSDLAMEGHQRKFAAPRQLLMWELRTILGMSFPRIGRIFDRDHTTVMYAVRKIEAQRGG